MKRLSVLAAAMMAALAAPVAFASPPPELSGPPVATWFNIGACVAQGGMNVTAGQPFSVRLGRLVSGTRGMVEQGMQKDATTVTVERPLGTPPVSVGFQWQSAALVPDSDPFFAGMWGVIRWGPVLTLSAGEQLKITLTVANDLPVRDLVSPSSSWDPTDFGFPPYDGTGLKYDGGTPPKPVSLPPVSCTVTGV